MVTAPPTDPAELVRGMTLRLWRADAHVYYSVRRPALVHLHGERSEDHQQQ